MDESQAIPYEINILHRVNEDTDLLIGLLVTRLPETLLGQGWPLHTGRRKTICLAQIEEICKKFQI
jgi:hypothetical protein